MIRNCTTLKTNERKNFELEKERKLKLARVICNCKL